MNSDQTTSFVLSPMSTTHDSSPISSPFTMDPILSRLSNPAEDDFILEGLHSSPIQPVQSRDDIQRGGSSCPGFTFNNDLASMASKLQASMLEPAPSTINPILLDIPPLPEISMSPINTPRLSSGSLPSPQPSSDASDHDMFDTMYQVHHEPTLGTIAIQTRPNSMESNQSVFAGSQSAPPQENVLQHPEGSSSPMSLDTDLTNPPTSVETSLFALGSSQSAFLHHDPLADQHPAGSGSPPMTLETNTNIPSVSNQSPGGHLVNPNVFSHPFFWSGFAMALQLQFYRAPPDPQGNPMSQPILIFAPVPQQLVKATSQSQMGILPPQPQLNPGLGLQFQVPPVPQSQRMYPHAGNGSSHISSNQVPTSMPGPQNAFDFGYKPVQAPVYNLGPMSSMSAGPVPLSTPMPMPMPALSPAFGPGPLGMSVPMAPPQPQTGPAPASRCISSPNTTDPSQQKRKRPPETPPSDSFVFCNQTAPGFVANPNNHGRWEVDAQGHRLYLNGPMAKRCRV